MKVLFYSSILNYTNGEKFFEASGCSTIRELIEKLVMHFGERFKEFVFESESCIFLVNGRGIMGTGGLDTKLNPDDKIELLPFAGAG